MRRASWTAPDKMSGPSPEATASEGTRGRFSASGRPFCRLPFLNPRFFKTSFRVAPGLEALAQAATIVAFVWWTAAQRQDRGKSQRKLRCSADIAQCHDVDDLTRRSPRLVGGELELEMCTATDRSCSNLDEIWTEAFGNVYNVNTTVARPGECRISTNHSTGEVQAFEEMSTKAFQPIAAAIQGTFLEV